MGNGNMGHCRSCGQLIVWVRTKSGRNMPCDTELIDYYIPPNKTGKERFVTPLGEVVAAERSKGAVVDGCGYISHFATCPCAGKHRKK